MSLWVVVSSGKPWDVKRYSKIEASGGRSEAQV